MTMIGNEFQGLDNLPKPDYEMVFTIDERQILYLLRGVEFNMLQIMPDNKILKVKIYNAN